MAQMTKEKTEHGTDKQQLEGIFERIMPHLLNLYGSTATAKDFEMYAPHATFEDPLMRAHGVDQIKSAFYTLPKVFGESKIVEYTVKENITGPGKVEFIIDNKQHYKVFGKDVDLTTQIRLNVEDGKVVRHEDWWDKKPLKNRDTVNIPFVGRAAEVTRRGSMLLTHAFMSFGKDPKP
ncbi:nuclear transport factor 2 (NTF2) family protein [Carex rostrata]